MTSESKVILDYTTVLFPRVADGAAYHRRLCCGCLVTQLGPTVCNLMDYSLPGSSVHAISQASTWWIVISFSGTTSQPRDQTQISCSTGAFFTAEPSGKPTWYFVSILIRFLQRIILFTPLYLIIRYIPWHDSCLEKSSFIYMNFKIF